MTCKDCRFWTLASHYDRNAPRGYGSCERIATVGYRWQENHPDEAPNPRGIHVEGDEGWGFYTGPAFGCVQFAAKV